MTAPLLSTVSAADLLFYAEQVRGLAETDQLAECADIIARHLEHHARRLLVADITGQAER